ncbi:hypothetical protein A3I40_02465 [Candidatus Uhrbacteria bacterium RIFCSPLOWO2_02_FULL_48_12]|uniref:Uncharacterized protein n=1 Tax=Candidatus Uhrbacteria bacterium RIFCSPLOWO2_02_FULL_48_12 TaxID=1802407 RepID=A0A1F7VBL3_9BACT|nr:MAG: hypothetical protein A3I40_02465 [Candidatus Uhrbacteria bacterium RIFCSPLOWO2_02_FULL_48_12]
MPEQQNINPVLNERWLKWASWWVNNRPSIQKIWLVAVIATEAILIGYSGYVWLDYLVFGRREEEQLYQDLSRTTDMKSLHQIMAPQPIAVLSADVLPAGGSGGSYDVLAKVANPNTRWVAFISYQFIIGGETAPPSVTETYILNSDERFVIGAGLARSASAKAEMAITNVRWQRLREPARFNERKPSFKVTDVSFAPVAERGGTYGSVSRVSFNVTNESSLNFWSVGFTIVLLQGDKAAAARHTTLDQVRSMEKRSVSLNIYNVQSSAVNKVLVVPEVNVADPDVFMSVPGGPIGF